MSSKPQFTPLLPPALRRLQGRQVAAYFTGYMLNLIAAVVLLALAQMYSFAPSTTGYTTAALTLLMGVATLVQVWFATQRITQVLIPPLYLATLMNAVQGDNLGYALAVLALTLMHGGQRRAQTTVTTLPVTLIGFLQLSQHHTLSLAGLVALMIPLLPWLGWTKSVPRLTPRHVDALVITLSVLSLALAGSH